METGETERIVLAVKNGEDGAAAALYDAFHKDLYYHILKTVNDPQLAEDLLQDTFMEILKSINDLEAPAAFLSWSRQIAYHKCTAYYKKRREVLADENEDGLSVFDTVEEDSAEFIPDEALDKDDLKRTIHAMIAELPAEQRSALLMRYFDEMSVKEIAEVQGVSEGTVKSRLNYGRKSIKQAVEGYEKKYGVKLRCVGVIPLLLWLFREYAVSHRIPLTAPNASASYIAPDADAASGSTAATAAPADSGSVPASGTPSATDGAAANGTASSAAKTAAKQAVKGAAKGAGKFAAKKIIAGIAAAVVALSGAAVGVGLLNKQQTKPDASEVQASVPSEPIEKADNVNWVGYGKVDVVKDRRFDLEIYKMTDSSISGHLEVSYLYKCTHNTEFTGTGTEADGKIIYELTFETPAVVGEKPLTYEYSQLELTYDKSREEFSFDKVYSVTMKPCSDEKYEVIAIDQSWSGLGTDSFYNAAKNSGHQFDIHVSSMTDVSIEGSLTVSYNGNVDHESAFTGRGYLMNGVSYYEILLDTPRTVEYITGPITIDRFWMRYDHETGTMTIPAPGLYSAEMKKN